MTEMLDRIGRVLADAGVEEPEAGIFRANRRIFTDTDARKGDGITCDFTTGVVTLAPGSYHVSGMSMVSYASVPPEMTTIRAPASAGYCRLRVFDPLAAVEVPEWT